MTVTYSIVKVKYFIRFWITKEVIQMKIERINENQIRCTLTSFDLSVRNLNLRELAYGSEKARSLFREMIQRASNEVGFDAEDIPLMVEAIPLSNESVMLVITKIEDPEELDTRFSKFSPFSDDDSDALSELASELLEGADGLARLLGISPVSPQESVDSSPDQEIPEAAANTRVYLFDSLDLISDAARVCGDLDIGPNTLYQKPDSRQYYLVLKNSGQDDLAFSRVCNILAEYGCKIRHEYASEAYYEEHYDIVCKDRALQIMKNI